VILHHHVILAVVRLGSVGGRVLDVDDLPNDFLGLWGRIAAGVEGGHPSVAATGPAAVGLGIVLGLGVVVGIGVVGFKNVADTIGKQHMFLAFF
jgi:hypothetical protein